MKARHCMFRTMATTLWPTVLAVVLLAVTVAVAAPAQPGAAPADGGEAAKPPTTGPAPRRRPPMPFRPRLADGSNRRESGIARGSHDANEKEPPRVYLLAPESSIGTTTREQPTLYWYISEPTERKVKLSLIPMPKPGGGGPRLSEPVLKLELKGVPAAGIQMLDLSKARGPDGGPVKLQKGTHYRWAVGVELSKSEGAKNPNAQCTLMRVDGNESLAAATSAGGYDAAAAYAAAGVWYDAVATLQQAIEADKADASLREARRELLASQKLVEDEKGNILDTAQR